MQCLKPLTGYRSANLNPNGKRSIIFTPSGSMSRTPITLPCGQCHVCRLQKSKDTAICAVHEAQLNEANCFITLTYSPENLPPLGTLVKKHFQDFMKRLRAKYSPRKIRYLQCGEYGEKLNRPHYHACLFNFDFADKKYWKTHNEEKYYISEELTEIWGLGHCVIGDVTFESAAYVGRYITKKRNGPRYRHHYEVVDHSTGEILGEKLPEYATMSQSIGRDFYAKYKKDIYPNDEVIIDHRATLPPKRYDRFLEKENPELFEEVKKNRNNQKSAVKKAFDNLNPDRLLQKEQLMVRNMQRLERQFENEMQSIRSL